MMAQPCYEIRLQIILFETIQEPSGSFHIHAQYFKTVRRAAETLLQFVNFARPASQALLFAGV
jgi:hypothetical protein